MLGPIRELSWESLSEPPQSLKNPTWNDVDTRIRVLGTDRSGSVFLHAANGSTLSIGGDRGSGYIAFISRDDVHRYLLAPPTERKGIASLVIGFQPAEYPRRIVVDLDASLKVAFTFFGTGRADESEEWTSDYKTIEV